MARVDVYLPYSFAKWNGLVQGVPTVVKRNGFADPRLRFSINLMGPKAMDPKELSEYFKSHHPTYTTIGASIVVVLPFGQNFEDKLLNLGQNRFVVRPQIGMLHNWGKCSYVLSSSVFIFFPNNSFFVGKQREQKPIFA